MRSRTFRWLVIPLMLLSLATGWQEQVSAQANIYTTRGILSGVYNNSWQPPYPKRSLGAEHNVTPTPSPQATPRVRPQVSSVGIILGAIVIVLIIIGGVIWSRFSRGSLKR